MNNSVLLVDDDPGVLDAYQTILSGGSISEEWAAEAERLLAGSEQDRVPDAELEYKLIVANNGYRAVQLHAEALSRGELVAVALVDMRMPPGISGLETAIKLRKQDPNIYIVIITAYSDYEIDEIQAALKHDFILLGKPVEPEEFRQITRNAVISYHRFIHLKHPVHFPLGEREEEGEQSAGKVLVVDNDSVTRQYCATLLEKQCNYQVFLAENGEDALNQIVDIDPDLVLMDVMMPGLDGYETCIRIKSNPDLSAIPVIFITARGEEKDVIRGFHVGGADYVTKPFSQEILLARVTTHLSQYRNYRKGEALSRSRLLKVMRSLNEGMVVTDRLGRITEVNSVVERMTRTPRRQLLGRSVSSLFVERVREEQKFSFREEMLQQVQRQLQKLIELRPLYFNQLVDDAPISIVEVMPESRAIVSANHRMLQLLKMEADAVVGQSVNDLLLGLSFPCPQEVYGIEISLTLQRPEGNVSAGMVQVACFPLHYRGGEQRTMVLIRQERDELDWAVVRLTAFGQLFDHQQQSREWGLKQQGGGVFPVLLQGGVYRDEYHHVEGGVLTLMDLRDRKQNESKEQFAAFQAGVAEMSANILHNIGNSVQGISTGVSQMKLQYQHYQKLISSLEAFNRAEMSSEERIQRQDELLRVLPETLRKIVEENGNSYSDLTSVEMVDHGIRHISEIIQLHRQGFKMDLQAVETNLYQLLDDALMLTGDRFSRQGIKLVKELRLEDTHLSVPRNQLLQALINLLINASDAVAARYPEGGAGRVIIRMQQLEREQQLWLLVEVEDNGIGIAEEERCKMLDLGYSTKKRGSGFGLHATANFLRTLDGEVVVKSEGAEKGATIALTFPIQ